MATKDYCKYQKDKHVLAFNDSTDIYSNFNLNKISKCTTAIDQKSVKCVEIGLGRNLNYDVLEKTNSQKANISLKKCHKNLSKDYFNAKFNDAKKEKPENLLCKKNSSTISLHIAAYENFVETNVIDSFADKELKTKSTTSKSSKNCAQQSVGFSFNDQLEFPRQQEDKPSKPEIQQFVASQKLLTPNQKPSMPQIVPLVAQIPEEVESQHHIRGQPPPQQQQQQQSQPQAPPQISPQITPQQEPPQPKSRACATNDKIETSRFASKESEYETKFANRYKDANFQSKEKMPEPFIWVNMPSQNLKNDRNRPRDNKKKGKNNDDYYRDREPRGRY